MRISVGDSAPRAAARPRVLPALAAVARPAPASGISITRRWNGHTVPPLYSSSLVSPTITTGSSMREISPKYRRGIHISAVRSCRLTTSTSDQVVFRNRHSLCSMFRIGG